MPEIKLPFPVTMADDGLLSQILESYRSSGAINHLEGLHLPTRVAVEQILVTIKQLLFPGYFEDVVFSCDMLPEITADHLDKLDQQLTPEIAKCLQWFQKKEKLSSEDISQKAHQIVQDFMSYIPKLRSDLIADGVANFNGDPAAKQEEEIILCYPGFLAITTYRIAHFLVNKKVPLIPRMMTEIAHTQTGIDLHPAAKIGTHLCIDHGTGIVVGETAVIGSHVKLYQGVTIGALSVPKRGSTEKRHPTLEDHVTVYARTTILGGKTVIGKHSIIGGNVWLTESVPPHSKLYLSPDLRQVLKRADQDA